jgi:hypothetical protein
MQNIRMLLEKILLALTSKEVWLSNCAIQSKFFFEKNFIFIWIRLKLSDSLRFELKIFKFKRILSIRIRCLTSIEIFLSRLKMNFSFQHSWKLKKCVTWCDYL